VVQAEFRGSVTPQAFASTALRRQHWNIDAHAGGYLEPEDLVFVLDVNPDYQPWLVERTRLFAAVNTLDGNKKRRAVADQMTTSRLPNIPLLSLFEQSGSGANP